jgi:hypothetical protein
MPQEHNDHARKRQRTTSPGHFKQALQHSKIRREKRKIAKVRAMDKHHQKIFKKMFADHYPINIDELRMFPSHSVISTVQILVLSE